MFHLQTDQDIKNILAQHDKRSDIVYLIENIPRIFASDYIPSFEDILHSSDHSTSCIRQTRAPHSFNVRIVDASKQCGTRRKWLHVFEDSSALLYSANLGEYDMTDENGTNMLHKTMQEFKELLESPSFQKHAHVYIFYCDIFEEKILTIPLTRCFPEYDSTFPTIPSLSSPPSPPSPPSSLSSLSSAFIFLTDEQSYDQTTKYVTHSFFSPKWKSKEANLHSLFSSSSWRNRFTFWSI